MKIDSNDSGCMRMPAAVFLRVAHVMLLLVLMAGLQVIADLSGADVMAAARAQSDWTLPWDRPRARRRAPQARVRRRSDGAAIQSGSNVCLQLEQQLVQESSRGAQAGTRLPRIEQDIRRFSRLYHASKRRLEHSKCFDTFLFIKTLRQSRKCRRLNRQTEDAQQRMRDLKAQRKQIKGGSRANSHQDEIINALARNRCGINYTREARRRANRSNPFSSFFWQDNDSQAPARRNRYGALPFATYRTLCVRLCDGYYFPVSFSTLPNHFQRDVNICQSKCAAPADLYYYQNPGGSVDQMVSATRQTPYTQLPSAWRYRKEYIRGCSCKQAEYNPAAADPNKKADAGGFSTTVVPGSVQR